LSVHIAEIAYNLGNALLAMMESIMVASGVFRSQATVPIRLIRAHTTAGAAD
jgi:hypothetical protein